MRERLVRRTQIDFAFQFLLALPVEALNLALVTLLFHLAFERRVEVVFYVIIGASFEVLGDFRPPVAVLDVEVKDFLVFFFRPLVFFNVRIQMVMPAFPALLPDAPGKEFSDLRPILGTVLLHAFNQLMIFCV